MNKLIYQNEMQKGKKKIEKQLIEFVVFMGAI